jgi:osmotically-inducible protein OsmY
MRHIFSTLLICSTLFLGGCGSLLATMEMDTIEDEPGKRTFGRWIEDGNVETKAMVNIHAAEESFHDSHVVVVSYNGYVLLAGQVNSERLKEKATDVTRDVRGVRRIYNELEIAAPSSAMTRTSDSWITTKVKSWLLGAENIQGSRVKVVTENGVVYLMGMVSNAESERIAEAASGISGVQRVVRLFELIE